MKPMVLSSLMIVWWISWQANYLDQNSHVNLWKTQWEITSLDAWKFQELRMIILSLSTIGSFTNDMFHHCYVPSPKYCHNIIFYKEWHPCRFHHSFGPLNNIHTIQDDLKLLLQFTINKQKEKSCWTFNSSSTNIHLKKKKRPTSM